MLDDSVVGQFPCIGDPYGVRCRVTKFRLVSATTVWCLRVAGACFGSHSSLEKSIFLVRWTTETSQG